ncbi:multiple inositol polyphosphate phosphatase 1 [Aethina tumida]|uniref:multiple inositol polyphosphate phosphatase 1 n=1 Tax=Aethina tumida TaxID=116153 RepID=UPI00096B5648|nr:multiple inositol polyphosphate phosphatase 1 [Aethina tumida]
MYKCAIEKSRRSLVKMETFVKYLFYTASLLNMSEQCTNAKYPYENHLATKTPYRIVANGTFGEVQYEGCTPVKAWMIVRHGTRNPSISFIEQYNNRLPQVRDLILENAKPDGNLHERDLDLFRNWKSRVDEEDDKKLRQEGEEEMMLLAERMQSRFPEVFDHIYSNTSYKFKYTHTQRTRKSAKYFTTGLFGKQTAKHVWYPAPSKKDPILRFYKLCSKWKTTVKDQPLPEKDKFMESQPWKKVVENVKKRLNLTDELTEDDIQSMYTGCAFETAWNKNAKSPWCSVFSLEDFKTLEYLEDLKYYYRDGYGHELTYKQACPAFNDLIDFFESSDPYPKSTVYFTHSGTLLKMLAHLRLYRDEMPLTADKYPYENRLWRSSKIDAFATNLAFILYKCANDYKVLTLHQERIIRLPCCPNSDLCDLKTMKKFYQESIESCDFNAMCANS